MNARFRQSAALACIAIILCVLGLLIWVRLSKQLDVHDDRSGGHPPVTADASQANKPVATVEQKASRLGDVDKSRGTTNSLVAAAKPGAPRSRSSILEKERFFDQRLNREVQIVKGEVMVRFKNTVTEENVADILARIGATSLQKKERLGIYRLVIPQNMTVSRFIDQHRTNESFQVIEPNFIASVQGSITPNDPLFPEQWALTAINAQEAWQITPGKPEIIVAVIDSGIELTHPDLKNKVVSGYDFVNGDSDPSDDHGHGTHVAGIIAAEGNNALGIVGLAWECSVLPVKVINYNGEGTYSDVIDGIQYAINTGARIFNFSIGGEAPSVLFAEAVEYAHSRGAVLVAAAGNDSTARPIYPAAFPNVIAMGAAGSGYQTWPQSKQANYVRLSAPGVDILSASLSNRYDVRTGTSASAAFASGAAALILSQNADFSNSQVEQILCRSALDLGEKGKDDIYGFGLLDAKAAIQASAIPFHDLAVTRIRIEPRVFAYGEMVYLLVTVHNQGTFHEGGVQLRCSVNGNEVSLPVERYEVLAGRGIDIPIPWSPSEQSEHALDITAQATSTAMETELTDNSLTVRLNYAFNQEGMILLYDVVPPVHQWIAFQGYNKLSSGPLKTELANYLPTNPSSSYYADTFAVPFGWKTDSEGVDANSSSTALIEGVWEADDPATKVVHHFWNPDGGYNDGILLYDSSLKIAQEDTFRKAVSYYSVNKAVSYYWLGRTVHLLTDLSVPAHTHLDEHLPITPDNYEKTTAYSGTYRDITSSSALTEIPSYTSTAFADFPRSIPADYDQYLTRLMYNLAEYSNDFDSDDHSGEDPPDRVSPIGHFNSWPAKNALNFQKTVSKVEKTSFTGSVLRLLRSAIDYELNKSTEWLANVSEVYYYPAFYDEINNTTARVKVTYTDSSSESFLNLDENLGFGWAIVPSTVIKRQQQPQLEARAIGYTAALYQLFWARTHITITTSSSPSNGGTTSGGGIKEKGSMVTVTASPNSCYNFVNWTENGIEVNRSSNYEFRVDQDRTLVANFSRKTYSITSSAGANGSVNPSGTFNKGCGEDQDFDASPNACYTVDKWYLDGSAVENGGTRYTLQNIRAGHTVHVTFKRVVFTITSSAGQGGSINPSGSFTKNCGDNQSFQATPSDCYSVDQWFVDGSLVQNGGASYALINIRSDHSVNVTFKKPEFVITSTAGPGGSIAPSGTFFKACGESQDFSATPDSCYSVDKWFLNGTPVQNGGNSYRLTNVRANHTVDVTFKAAPSFIITASAGGNGSISPSGMINKNCGTTQLFTAATNSCYTVDQWYVDGTSAQTGGTTYELTNIQADKAVLVTFKRLVYSITASSGNNGALSPSGAIAVGCGTNQTFRATPDPGYSVERWYLDGNPVQVGGSAFILYDVKSDYAVSVAFTCSVTLNPSNVTFSSSGGSSNINVTTGADCSWVAIETNDWITITSETSGLGIADLRYDVSANPATQSRQGSITIGGLTVVVAQLGQCRPISTPELRLPACGGLVNSGTPLLQWSSAPNQSGYFIRIFLGSGCSGTPIDTSSVNNTSYGVPSSAGLQPGETYSWQVQAKGDGNTYCDSEWSACCSFVVNPFPAYAGAYHGLFYDTNGVLHESSGFCRMVLDSSGSVSGMVVLSCQTNLFSAVFDPFSKSAEVILPEPINATLSLGLNTSGTSKQITGTIASSGWEATLVTDQRGFSQSAPVPPNILGRYTLIIPPDPNNSAGPAGAGYGTLSLSRVGRVDFVGTNADSTALTQSVPISADGDWPLFSCLYKGKGSFMAWMKFSADWRLENDQASWIRPSMPTRFYPNGFSNQMTIVASRFVRPVYAKRIINATDAKLIFSGGNLPADVTCFARLRQNNTILRQSPTLLSMSINTNIGTFQGTFKAPGFPKVYTFRGAVLQNSNAGWGYFLGTNQSGHVYFGPR